VVNVATSKPWKREEFFAWLDREIAVRGDIRHVGDLAEQAGLHPSTLSNWRTGKVRPSPDKLALLAPILGVPARELWARAGVLELTDADLGPNNLNRTAAGDWYVDMVERANLPRATKDQLIQRRRGELAAERQRAEEQIKLMEELQRQ